MVPVLIGDCSPRYALGGTEQGSINMRLSYRAGENCGGHGSGGYVACVSNVHTACAPSQPRSCGASGVPCCVTVGMLYTLSSRGVITRCGRSTLHFGDDHRRRPYGHSLQSSRRRGPDTRREERGGERKFAARNTRRAPTRQPEPISSSRTHFVHSGVYRRWQCAAMMGCAALFAGRNALGPAGVVDTIGLCLTSKLSAIVR